MENLTKLFSQNYQIFLNLMLEMEVTLLIQDFVLWKQNIQFKIYRFACRSIGSNRAPFEPITEYHKDLAFNVQWRLEQVVSSMINFRIKKENLSDVCLAGGVSMNCKMNGIISN